MTLLGNLFNRRPSSLVQVDMHSHLVPGVDDGVKTTEEALSILENFQILGYRKVITTPHIYPEVFPNSEVDVRRQFEDLKQCVDNKIPDLKLELGAEYFVDEQFLRKIETGTELLKFGGSYVLIETAFGQVPMILNEVIFALRASNLTPIMAHPERYAYVNEDPDLVSQWRSRGVRMQVSIPSLQGRYGPDVQKTARSLIKYKMVDFIGSDVHNMRHMNAVGKGIGSKWDRKLRDQKLLNDQL